MRLVRWSLALLVFIVSVLVSTVASAAPPAPGPAGGSSQPEIASASVVAAGQSWVTVPGAPTGVSATVGSDGEATVSWRPPASDGGAPITSYEVTPHPGGPGIVSGSAPYPATKVYGLTAGTVYSFTVTAFNSAGAGPASALSGAITARQEVSTPALTALTSPGPGATGVAQDSVVSAVFNESVTGWNEPSVVTLRDPAGALVPAYVRYEQSAKVAKIIPGAPLAADTRYTVTLIGGATGIRDLSGTPLATVSWTFTTGPAPTVTAQTPAVDASAVTRSANVTATFSEPVLGVTGSSVTLRNAAGATVAATVRYDAATRTVTVDPAADLAADTRYTVTLTGGPTMIRDAAGNPLRTVTWAFSTGTAPTFMAGTPADGSTGVAVTTTVTTTFSEAVSGVSSSSFQLVDGSGVVVPAVVTYNSATRTATLDPRASLAAGSEFIVLLNDSSGTIRDAGGNVLARSTWSFST
jgi:methionine-rich copper-binding protein CopC